MKLTVQCVRDQGARLCKLTEVGQCNKTLQTPMCMMYTRGGSAPYMTCDMLQKVAGVPELLQMPLNQLAQYEETITGYKKGMLELSALHDKLVYTSLHDTAVTVKSGYNTTKSVGLWGKAGKYTLDVEGFMKIQEAVLPDWFQCMADTDTDRQSGPKRVRKSVDRTLTFLDQIVDKHKHSQRLQGSSLFGTIVGGYSVSERQRSARETVARNVDGYVLDGFHNCGPETESFSIPDVTEILQAIMTILPDDRTRVMCSVWRPDSVIHGVEMGIDVFDSSYPYIVTERGCALVFNTNYKSSCDLEDTDIETAPGFTIDLNSKQYADDFSPLVQNCSCYCCQNFTRAYINHLLNTSELLARILLLMHNYQHYFQYFTDIRQALAEDKFGQLKQLIMKQQAKE